MSDVVVYKSIFGATKIYANWVAGFLKVEAFKFGEANKSVLSCNDRVIVLSGTYAGQMPLTKFLKDNWAILKDKDVYVVAVGCSDKNSEGIEIAYNGIPLEIRERIHYYNVMGAMPFSDKTGKVEKGNLKKLFDDLKVYN